MHYLVPCIECFTMTYRINTQYSILYAQILDESESQLFKLPILRFPQLTYLVTNIKRDSNIGQNLQFGISDT